jgi:hypothetical protein
MDKKFAINVTLKYEMNRNKTIRLPLVVEQTGSENSGQKF